jgi:hypothetical protein
MTVAFGVPASVATAILMGAFLIQGLVPGPAMLAPAPRGHLTVTLTMVWTIVISNVITVAICLAFMNQLARITRLRGTLLVPFILTMVYVGAFAEKNVFEDLGVVLAFGALGWVMARLRWPRPPVLLGLVLGPLAENRLFLSTDNYGAAWLLRPGVLVLLGLIALGLIAPLVSAYRRRRAAAPPSRVAVAPRRRLDAATAFTLGLIGLFAWALWQSRGFDLRAGLFPWVITTSALTLALVQLGREVTGRQATVRADTVETEGEADAATTARPTAAICGWILAMFGAIWLLGFSPATFLTTFLYLKLGAREPWGVSLTLSLAAFLFVYGLFERGLGVPFPAGRLVAW